MDKLRYPVAIFTGQIASTVKQDTHLWWFRPLDTRQFGDIICVSDYNKYNCYHILQFLGEAESDKYLRDSESSHNVVCLLTPNQRYQCYKPVIKRKYLILNRQNQT